MEEEIDKETAETITLLRSTGMKWYRIAEQLGIDRKTLYLLRSKMPAEQTFSVELSDEELWSEIEAIKMENPHFGEVYVRAALLSRGFKIPRQRMRDCIQAMDPEGVLLRRLKPKIPRGIYWVPGSMYVWHTDGNEKQNMFGIYLHGCIDGHSRYPLYLNCTNNKDSLTTLKMFYDAALKYGLPYFLRMDKGGENVKYAEFMQLNAEALGREENPVLVGPSTKNVRIERFWGEVNNITRPFKHLFFEMQHEGILSTGDPTHLFSLHYIYIPRIQKALDNFVNIWNVHSMSSAHGDSPSAMFLTERYGVHNPVTQHPTIVGNPEEERTNFENNEFAQSVIPDPLVDDRNHGKNLYIQLRNAIQNSLAQ